MDVAAPWRGPLGGGILLPLARAFRDVYAAADAVPKALSFGTGSTGMFRRTPPHVSPNQRVAFCQVTTYNRVGKAVYALFSEEDLRAAAVHDARSRGGARRRRKLVSASSEAKAEAERYGQRR